MFRTSLQLIEMKFVNNLADLDQEELLTPEERTRTHQSVDCAQRGECRRTEFPRRARCPSAAEPKPVFLVTGHSRESNQRPRDCVTVVARSTSLRHTGGLRTAGQ
jgi:hypothetical protein